MQKQKYCLSGLMVVGSLNSLGLNSQERLGRMMGSGPHDPSYKENVVPDTPEAACRNFVSGNC